MITSNLAIDSFGDLEAAQVADIGLITIRDAELMANTIKVRAYASSGDALIIDGAIFNKERVGQLVKLYAEGASTLRFQNKVEINTAVAILAGKTVEVDAGGFVNISGKGRVFADKANFNTGTYGTIHAGGGLSVKCFDKKPGF